MNPAKTNECSSCDFDHTLVEVFSSRAKRSSGNKEMQGRLSAESLRSLYVSPLIFSRLRGVVDSRERVAITKIGDELLNKSEGRREEQLQKGRPARATRAFNLGWEQKGWLADIYTRSYCAETQVKDTYRSLLHASRPQQPDQVTNNAANPAAVAAARNPHLPPRLAPNLTPSPKKGTYATRLSIRISYQP